VIHSRERAGGQGGPTQHLPTLRAARTTDSLRREGGGVQGGATQHPPAQEDITFFLNVYRDFALARRCLLRVRAHYPASRIVVVSDGDHDPRYLALAAELNLAYSVGERLYLLSRGGALVQRMLDLFLAHPSACLLKLDTDTLVHRRFRWLPAGDSVFGTLEHRTNKYGEPLQPPNVQGGCLGLTLAAARRLRESEVFASSRLNEPRSTWACCRDMAERVAAGYVSFDFLVRYGCSELAIPAVEFDEVRSLWRGRVDNPGLRYAATHPHKSARLSLQSWLGRHAWPPR